MHIVHNIKAQSEFCVCRSCLLSIEISQRALLALSRKHRTCVRFSVGQQQVLTTHAQARVAKSSAGLRLQRSLAGFDHLDPLLFSAVEFHWAQRGAPARPTELGEDRETEQFGQ